MKDPFVGCWNCAMHAFPDDIESVLGGSILEISESYEVTWTRLGTDPISSTASLQPGKLSGTFMAGEKKHYYEIAITTPSRDLGVGSPRIYGIVCRIDEDANGGVGGDLEDPGTWTAEETDPVPCD